MFPATLPQETARQWPGGDGFGIAVMTIGAAAPMATNGEHVALTRSSRLASCTHDERPPVTTTEPEPLTVTRNSADENCADAAAGRVAQTHTASTVTRRRIDLFLFPALAWRVERRGLRRSHPSKTPGAPDLIHGLTHQHRRGLRLPGGRHSCRDEGILFARSL